MQLVRHVVFIKKNEADMSVVSWIALTVPFDRLVGCFIADRALHCVANTLTRRGGGFHEGPITP